MTTKLAIEACDLLLAQDVVRALLHTILFHRLFGQIVPKQLEILDMTVAAVDDPELEALVDERAASYIKALRAAHVSAQTTATYTAAACSKPAEMPTLAIDFYEKRTRKGWFLGRAEEQVCWESWQICIHRLSSDVSREAQQERRHQVEGAVEKAMMQVIQTVNERNEGYLPPIPYNEAGSNPFPYVIEVRTAGQTEIQTEPAEQEGWFGR